MIPTEDRLCEDPREGGDADLSRMVDESRNFEGTLVGEPRDGWIG